MIVTKIEERLKSFQRGKDLEDIRRRREEDSVQLRKVKRSEHIAKKRALTGKVAQSTGDTSESLTFGPDYIPQFLAQLHPALLSDQLQDSERLDRVLDLLSTSDFEVLTSATEAIRKVLAAETSPPINYIGLSPAASRLVSFLGTPHEPLVLESVWCVTNICSGSSELVHRMISHGLLPALMRLLSHTNEEIFDQTVWALSNIAGDSVAMRDQIISAGVGEFIREKLLATSRLHLGIIGNMVWLLSNLCRGKPLPKESFIASLLPILPIGIHLEKEEIQADICWICSYITDGGDRVNINELLNLKLLPKLVELMLSPNAKVQAPALRTIGNIASGDTAQTQMLLVAGCLDRLSVVLTSKRKATRKEALWCLSNIAAGSCEQRIEVMRSPCLSLAVQAVSDVDVDIKKEALWTIFNLANSKEIPIVASLLSKGILKILIPELSHKDSNVLHPLLGCIECLLRPSHVEGVSSESEVLFEELGGLTMLEKLQHHDNKAVYETVIRLMDEFYGLMAVEEEPQSEGVPQGGFAFS